MSGDFTPCERTVRMCIEALGYAHVVPEPYGNEIYKRQHAIDVAALQALLPDPAKALAQSIWEGFGGQPGALPKDVLGEMYTRCAHHLIATGKIRNSDGR